MTVIFKDLLVPEAVAWVCQSELRLLQFADDSHHVMAVLTLFPVCTRCQFSIMKSM